MSLQFDLFTPKREAVRFHLLRFDYSLRHMTGVIVVLKGDDPPSPARFGASEDIYASLQDGQDPFDFNEVRLRNINYFGVHFCDDLEECERKARELAEGHKVPVVAHR